MLCLLFVDQTRRKIGVNRHLLAGNSIEREAGTHFRDTRRTLGDDEEVDDDEDRENHKTDDKITAHHKL